MPYPNSSLIGLSQIIPPVMPDYHTVVFDETNGFDQNFLKKHGITKVEAVYLFNQNQHVYLAEITPSYELRFAGVLFEATNDHGTPQNCRAYEALCDAYNMSEQHKFVSTRGLTNVQPFSNFADWPEDQQTNYRSGDLTRDEADEQMLDEYRANPTRH